jgi:hypothetical protein
MCILRTATRRPRQEAQEKPPLPHPDDAVAVSKLPEPVVQEKEESKRSTCSAPQWGQWGEGSLELNTKFSKHLSQQQQRYS